MNNNPPFLVLKTRPGTYSAALIKSREGNPGIVGLTQGKDADGKQIVLVYFEGNLYDAVNMRSWRERIIQAAYRMRTSYPTIARATLLMDDFVTVATLDVGEDGKFYFIPANWEGVES